MSVHFSALITRAADDCITIYDVPWLVLKENSFTSRPVAKISCKNNTQGYIKVIDTPLKLKQ